MRPDNSSEDRTTWLDRVLIATVLLSTLVLIVVEALRATRTGS